MRPKDFSTLALVINNRLWKQAGLTEDDVPTTWTSWWTVAEKLTKGNTVGLVYGAEVQRVGVFLEQNGGGLTNEEGTEATADSPENVEALTFVQEMMQDGVAAYAVDVGAGWGGEAFGKELGAMTIEGNWITGAMQNDFPDVDYQEGGAARRNRGGDHPVHQLLGRGRRQRQRRRGGLAGRAPHHAGAADGVRRRSA